MKLRLLRGVPNAQGHPCPGGSAAAQRKAGEIVARLHSMRLGKATELVETAIPETLANYAFPEEAPSPTATPPSTWLPTGYGISPARAGRPNDI